MEHRRLSDTGLSLSSLTLGTSTWGMDTEVYDCASMLRLFQDAGGYVLDIDMTGEAAATLETIRDLFLSDDFSREDFRLIIRTGMSRSKIFNDVATVTRALATDYIDVLLVSGPRNHIPFDETLSALSSLYTSGTARYLGMVNLSWWDGGCAWTLAHTQGFRFDAWAGELSLLRPALSAAPGQQILESGLGIIAGAPLSLGILTGKYRHSTPADSRATTPRFGSEIRRRLTSRTPGIVDSLTKAAEGLDHSPAQIAVAWTLAVPGVATVAIGPRTPAQLTHILDSADWRLPATIHNALSEVALSKD
ncbi:aldo/keto reductase [Actinomycetaceae bacterium WB03_NA08]|uniref:Aldo/keto reductase n=1 Tax=Scrofimicrobium canadense TaxID=2652290 RepID=A0A6N7VST2_9ACTO|nr:aldo/keto reductase [Scrofimicrobium canadense]MSS84010.1 aldo/keto reductase [Scrofimicrobium canadense]